MCSNPYSGTEAAEAASHGAARTTVSIHLTDREYGGGRVAVGDDDPRRQRTGKRFIRDELVKDANRFEKFQPRPEVKRRTPTIRFDDAVSQAFDGGQVVDLKV